jgi:hypothetical protein
MKYYKKNLKKRLLAIFEIIKQPAENFNNETFHQLRVAIKKLKTYIEILQYESQESISICNPLKKLFHLSGKIRNHQITILKIEQLCPEKLNNYKLNIDKRIQHLKFHFFKLVAQISWKKIYAPYKKNPIHCRSISFTSLNHYINTLKSDILYSYYTNLEKAETLHTERILLKKYVYALHFLPPAPHHQKEFIDLTESLGNWHYNQVIENQLKKYLKSRKIFSTEIDAIKNCLKIINNLKKQLYNQSLKKISTLVVDNPNFLEFHVYI